VTAARGSTALRRRVIATARALNALGINRGKVGNEGISGIRPAGRVKRRRWICAPSSRS
jgi:hypothetical protein